MLMTQWLAIEDNNVEVIINFKNSIVCKQPCKEPGIIFYQYPRNVLMLESKENGPTRGPMRGSWYTLTMIGVFVFATGENLQKL